VNITGVASLKKDASCSAARRSENFLYPAFYPIHTDMSLQQWHQLPNAVVEVVAPIALSSKIVEVTLLLRCNDREPPIAGLRRQMRRQ
jgi:hypothetical protein